MGKSPKHTFNKGQPNCLSLSKNRSRIATWKENKPNIGQEAKEVKRVRQPDHERKGMLMIILGKSVGDLHMPLDVGEGAKLIQLFDSILCSQFRTDNVTQNIELY